jgi:hypothetical protein
MLTDKEHRKAPIDDRAKPDISNLYLPIISASIPEGISVNILDRNQADATSPTSIPDGSSSYAKIGRKEEARLILKIKVKEEAKSSKYALGYDPRIS